MRRVKSGTDRTEDRRSRFSASRNCAERDTFRPAIRTQNFHHHGPSGGRSEPSSGPRKSLRWSKDQTQKTALVTTSALPATTNTSPRITIAVLLCCHHSLTRAPRRHRLFAEEIKIPTRFFKSSGAPAITSRSHSRARPLGTSAARLATTNSYRSRTLRDVVRSSVRTQACAQQFLGVSSQIAVPPVDLGRLLSAKLAR